MNAVAPDAVPGGPHDAVPVPELREADPGGLQGPGQEPADPAGRGGAGAGVAAVQAPDQQARGSQGGPGRPVAGDAEEGRRRAREGAHPQRERGPGRRRRKRKRREGGAAAEPAEDAEPGGGAGAGVQGDEGPDVQDGQGQVPLRRRLLPPDRRRQRPAEAVLRTGDC